MSRALAKTLEFVYDLFLTSVSTMDTARAVELSKPSVYAAYSQPTCIEPCSNSVSSTLFSQNAEARQVLAHDAAVARQVERAPWTNGGEGEEVLVDKVRGGSQVWPRGDCEERRFAMDISWKDGADWKSTERDVVRG